MAARFAVSTGVVSGAFTWNNTAGLKWATTATGVGGQSVPGTADDVTFGSSTSSSSYTATRTVTTGLRSLSLSGPSSGTLTFNTTSSMAIGAGGLTIAASGVTATGWTGALTFNATCTINANLNTVSCPITMSGAGTTKTISSDLYTTGTISVASGTFSLNGFRALCSSFSLSSGATLQYGTGGSGEINVANLVSGGTALNLAGTVVNPGAATVGTNNLASTIISGGTSSVALTIVDGVNSSVAVTTSGAFSSLTFFDNFNGTFINSGVTVRSSFTIPTRVTWTGAGALAVDGTLITNGRTLGGPLASYTNSNITVTTTLGSNVNATALNFADSSTLNVGTYTLTVGSITLSTFDVSFPTINMSGGRIVVTGTGTSEVLGGTFGANSIIEFTTAATRTLSNPNSANLTVINSAGTLTLSGSSLVLGTIQASTGILQLPASQTTTVTNVVLSNSTLRSATAGTPATIYKASGTVNFVGMTFRDIAATGGAVWRAPSNLGNVNSGNSNTGIDFSPTTTNSGNFFALLI